MIPSRAALAVATLAVLLFTGGCGQAPDPELARLRDLIDDGEYAAAESSAREKLKTTEAKHGERSVETAEVLDLLVESLWRAGKFGDPEATELADRALEIKQAELGADHEGVATSLNNLAIMNFYLGEYQAAQSQWQRALTILQKTAGHDQLDAARIMNGLGVIKTVLGDLPGSRAMHEQALAIRKQALDPDHPSIAQSLQNLSMARNEMGDYAGALPLMEESLRIKQKTLGPDHPKTGGVLIAYAGILQDTGAYEASLPFLERARAIYEREETANPDRLGAVLNNEAEALRRTGDLPAAAERYEQALRIWEETRGLEHSDLAVPLGNLGEVKELPGEFETAIALHTRAVALREASLDDDDFLLASSRHNLARALLGAGEHARARKLFEGVVASLERTLGSRHPQLAESLSGYGRAVAIEGDIGRALELALESERIAREHRRLTGRSFSEERALAYAAARESGLDLALTLVASGRNPSAVPATFDALIRSRAIVLDEMAARHRASVLQGDPATAELVGGLAEARSMLAHAVVRGPDGDVAAYRDRLDVLIKAKADAERLLATASLEFAGERRREGIGLDEVGSVLPARSALVAFALFDPVSLAVSPGADGAQASYLAFVLSAGRAEPSIVPIGSAAKIDPLVAAWKRQAAGGAHSLRRTEGEMLAAYREHGAPLRAAIWDPLAAHLTSAERLFVVPDGSLNMVSWASLPVGESQYLIERGPALHYLSAERDLVPASDRARVGSGLLALGGADYDDGALLAGDTDPSIEVSRRRGERSNCASFASHRFEALPATKDELDSIVASWREFAASRGAGEVTTLSGAGAGEAAFKRAAPGKRVLHLATHGYFLDNECSFAGGGTRGIEVVQTEPAPDEATPLRVSPLLLSGLAMAGANQRRSTSAGGEDGILTAEEIAGLDLSRAEWAVLSACNTGVGEIQPGEGVLGLRRAMQIAGVRSLIMSLWPVDDVATRAWMEALYESRFEHEHDTTESVRRAGRSVLDARRAGGESTHPFYWAAFVGAGDWR